MPRPEKLTYWEKLKDPRWLKRREEILDRDGHSCTCCHSEERLQVHHQYYIKDREPWDYPEWALVTYCEEHHKESHPIDAKERTMFEMVMENFCGDNPIPDWWVYELSKAARAAREVGMRSEELTEASELLRYTLDNIARECRRKRVALTNSEDETF